MLRWCVTAFPEAFTCDPGPIDDRDNTWTAVHTFEGQYNRAKHLLQASDQPDLELTGTMGPLNWGALFDVVQFGIAREMGESVDGATALRQHIRWQDDGRRALGFGEHHPIDALGRDDYDSLSNRRVELLFFDEKDIAPDVAAAEADPATSELYAPGVFQRSRLPRRASGRASPRLKLRLLDSRRNPLPRKDYVLEVLGVATNGTTDAEGSLNEPVPEGATTGRLTIGEMRMDLAFQPLPPVDTPRGAQMRLSNLGFSDVDRVDGDDSPAFQALLASVQDAADVHDGSGLDARTTAMIANAALS